MKLTTVIDPKTGRKGQIGDWPAFAREFRRNRNTVIPYLMKYKNKVDNNEINFSDDEICEVSLKQLAILDGPLVQYSIPLEMYDILSGSSIDIDLPISTYVNLPFPIMALAPSNAPSKWTLIGLTEGYKGIMIIQGYNVAYVELNKTIRQISGGENSEGFKGILELILYISGGDHSCRVVSSPRKKKDRDNGRPTVIRGEVGGKFMSALRRYEAQQEAEDASRPHGSPRPHIRAGHFHLYWTGEGSRKGTVEPIPKIKFLHPCLVNADNIGPDVEIRRTVKS